MNLAPVTKIDKRNTAASKIFDDDVMSINCDILLFFQFMVNLEQTGSQIPDACSVKLTFSLRVTFYPKKR